MTLLLTILFFFAGYYFSNWRNKKKLEVARLIGIKGFVYGYCEQLRERCNSILEKVKTDALKGKKKTLYAHMLSVFSHVHDELVEIWKNEGEDKLTELLQETISDNEVFGKTLEKKMNDLDGFENKLDIEDPESGLKLITDIFRVIEEIRTWVKDYVNNQDSYIKTVAIETVALLDIKEAILKMIGQGLSSKKDTFGEEAKEALEKQSYYTDRYVNAMKLLLGS